MNAVVQASDFATFFSDVYGKDKNGLAIEPFPWQQRMAERVCGSGPKELDGWPECIALPTAAGKTACIDIAVFAMACQASFPARERTAPRRIFFVIDRRAVVDQAFEHAKQLASKLANPHTPMLRRVAAALQQIGADKARPLDAYVLRGGIYRENAWVRSPLQPTVIVSTVDQVGSRLLFRGYGVSDASKPIHAALVGNDALILLDEAHCARPFGQTMALVEKYRRWVEEQERSLLLPFHFVQVTATPSHGLNPNQIEHLQEPDRTHPVLGKRIDAKKPATLVKTASVALLVKKLAEEARRLRQEGYLAIGVIVNRVATARALKKELGQAVSSSSGKSEKGQTPTRSDPGAEVVLLTGRMRPMDRDAEMKKIVSLFSGSSQSPERPMFVVATQCLEVGADLDFDAMVTECASLDALRQRFGRLDRLGARGTARAVVVICADQTAPSETASKQDPVYGNSLAHTWHWLNQHKDGATAQGNPWIDMGIAAFRNKWENTPDCERVLLAVPAPDAAVLLPTHLDAWCQTLPRPTLDPDPAPFLHGPQHGEPEVQIIFRADLGDDPYQWADIVSLCPPTSAEALPVRLRDFRRWLKNEEIDQTTSDIEGGFALPNGEDERTLAEPVARRALRWRGPDARGTALIDAVGNATAHDVYIIPIIAGTDLEALGDFPTGAPNDQGDEAFQQARDRALLRLTPTIQGSPALGEITLQDEDVEIKITEALVWLEAKEANEPESPQRSWRLKAIEELSKIRYRSVKPHPLGGLVLIGRRRLHQFDPLEPFIEPADSWETSTDRPYFLDQHCRDVAQQAREIAMSSGLFGHSQAIETAGSLHDTGKADPRFQAWLHGGNRHKASLYPLLAKSMVSMPTRKERSAARERAGYPSGGRHELFSVRLAECDGAIPIALDAIDRDLVLHLVAAHHGFCRPLAPVIAETSSESYQYDLNRCTLTFTPDPTAVSGHGLERLDSGTTERFWALTRHFGWWGLAYLEAILRLADWACVEPPSESESAP